MKKTFSLFFIAVLIVSFYSCEKQESIEDTINLKLDKIAENAVSTDEAITFAQNFMNNNSELKSAKNIKQTRKLNLPFRKRKLFLVEFEPSGFVLMSDNKLDIPVLAYSDTDNLNYADYEYMPEELQFYLKQAVFLNFEIEADTTLQRLNNIVEKWNNNLQKLKGATVLNPEDCTEIFNGHVVNTYSDASLTTEWNQGLPYNSCMNDCPLDGHPYPAGCVAIAVGQVMNFWEYPESWDWSSIYDEYDSVQNCSWEVAQLIEDIGSAVNMVYTCTGSGSTSVYAMGSLVNSFNYSSDITLKTYSFSNDFRNNLKWGYPVLMFGNIPGGAGHAWVVDGLREEWDEYIKSCPSPRGPVISNISKDFSYYLHMNWGWGNYENENTWYFSLNIAYPTNKTYNFSSNMEVIINIYP